MPLSFQSPAGLLVTLVAIAPLAALVVHERRSARLREALGLAGPGHARTIASAGVVAACFVLLGLAAARPVLRLRSPERARTDAAAFVVVDVSRSMLAAPRRAAATRYARAITFARLLRPRLG